MTNALTSAVPSAGESDTVTTICVTVGFVAVIWLIAFLWKHR